MDLGGHKHQSITGDCARNDCKMADATKPIPQRVLSLSGGTGEQWDLQYGSKIASSLTCAHMRLKDQVSDRLPKPQHLEITPGNGTEGILD